MTVFNANLLNGVLAAFVRRDLEGALAFFADDAIIFDPHYPVAEMRGKPAIRRGLAWALGNMEKPGFVIRHIWLEGDTGAAEVDTDHLFKGGMKFSFRQVFVFEIRDDLLTQLRAYVPYPPPGIGGWIARLTRLMWRIGGKT